MSILKLSYHNLTPLLKSCFSYCALFPKDFELEKEKLISLWMAQGYIMPWNDSQSIEDVAEEHFVILLQRCFFQDVVKDDCGSIWSVKIHDLMHDVAQEVGKDAIKVVTSMANNLGNKIRHVRYDGNCCVESSLCSSKIRSFICSDARASFVGKWKCLRVLDLSCSGFVKLPDSIGKLIHLRYLDLSCNGLEVLPHAITRLHNLQTLLLYDCWKLREFPKDFCKLDKLRHLDLKFCKLSCMPSGMEKLISLKVLPLFVVGKKVSREVQRDDELKPLKALTGIKGQIRIEIGKYYRNQVEGTDDMGGGYLKGMEHLAKVEIEFEDKQGGWDSLECERVLGMLEAPLNVKVLTIIDYDGIVIPKWGRAVDDWSMFFSILGDIHLQRCRNLKEIPMLRKLRSLKQLHLGKLDNLEYMETSNGSQASEEIGDIFFPSLEKLTIRGMKKLKGWWKGVGDDHPLNTTGFIFPCLSKLEIDDCPELTSFPPCPSLEWLVFTPGNETLQIKTRGKEDDNINSKLRELIVDSMSHLKSLPINCLTSLRISTNETEEREESVAEAFQRCASSLQSLQLRNIKNIWRLWGGSGLEHFTALESLRFEHVIPRLSIKSEEDDDEDEDEDEDGDNSSLLWKSIPQNLRTLALIFLKEEKSLPKGMQYLTSLQNLVLFRCEKVEGVPDWIDCLSSLQSLSIGSCPAIKSLPQSFHNLTSLKSLLILGCPDLKQRCEKPGGEDYPKIRNIPKIIFQ